MSLVDYSCKGGGHDDAADGGGEFGNGGEDGGCADEGGVDELFLWVVEFEVEGGGGVEDYFEAGAVGLEDRVEGVGLGNVGDYGDGEVAGGGLGGVGGGDGVGFGLGADGCDDGVRGGEELVEDVGCGVVVVVSKLSAGMVDRSWSGPGKTPPPAADPTMCVCVHDESLNVMMMRSHTRNEAGAACSLRQYMMHAIKRSKSVSS